MVKAVCKCPVCGADMKYDVDNRYFQCTACPHHQMTLAEWSDIKEPRKVGEIVEVMKEREIRLRRLATPEFPALKK